MKLALFDLDGTLLPFDSDHAWGDFCVEQGWVDGSNYLQRNQGFYHDYLDGQLDVHAYVAFATEVLTRHSLAELRTMHEQFMCAKVIPSMSPEVLALLNRYHAEGWVCALVTATNEFVTRPIAKAFGFEHLIATELERSSDGRWRNVVRGQPCLQSGKVVRVTQWLAAQGASWSGLESSVLYTDSWNDLALMEAVTTPVAANPDEKLRAIAQSRGWQIVDWFR